MGNAWEDETGVIFCPGEFSDNLKIFFKKSDLTFSKTFAIIILEVKGTAINLPEKNKKST